VGGAYAQQFADAIARAPNDFVRSVLADGVITLAELQEAQSRTLACIAGSGLGIEAAYVPNAYGGSNLAFDVFVEDVRNGPSEEQKQAVSDCEQQWIMYIDALYSMVVANPNNEDGNDLIAACLVRHNLVAPGFTGTDYAEVLARYYEQNPGLVQSYTIGSDDDGNPVDADGTPVSGGAWSSDGATPVDGEIPEMILPGGVSMSDPVAQACTIVPLR
jgi:hypothetical protein